MDGWLKLLLLGSFFGVVGCHSATPSQPIMYVTGGLEPVGPPGPPSFEAPEVDGETRSFSRYLPRPGRYVLHDSEEGQTTIREVVERWMGGVLTSCIPDYEVCLHLDKDEIIATSIEDDDTFLWFRDDMQVGDAIDERNMVMEVVAFDEEITVAGVTTSETVVFRVTWTNPDGTIDEDAYEYWAAGLGPIKWVDANDGSETLAVTEISLDESVEATDQVSPDAPIDEPPVE